jgi:hypothetical protein
MDPATDSFAVADWQASHFGIGGLGSDLGTFAAKSWLVCHFHSLSARAATAKNEYFNMLDEFRITLFATFKRVVTRESSLKPW